MGTPTPQGELLPGTLDMLILKTVSRGPLHGYGIAQFIARASNGRSWRRACCRRSAC
jgi:DNA-binding PadR family transcriptional regulator